MDEKIKNNKIIEEGLTEIPSWKTALDRARINLSAIYSEQGLTSREKQDKRRFLYPVVTQYLQKQAKLHDGQSLPQSNIQKIYHWISQRPVAVQNLFLGSFNMSERNRY